MQIKVSVLTLACLFFNLAGFAQTIWNGPKMTFNKMDSTDWTQAANQDRITDSLWLTRAHTQGIFNIVKETSYTQSSPVNSEWAVGTTANLSNLTFSTWKNAINSTPSSFVGHDMVLHIISDDIYIDIKFLSWTSGGNGDPGGGVSYERSTHNIGLNEQGSISSVSIFPNPAGDLIELTLEEHHDLMIIDVAGKEIKALKYAPGQSIDISELPEGVYFIRGEKLEPTRFVKK
ncbi:MAG: T9SS type A sorting domain-containing protein [Owenweeksia sp.]